MTVKVVSMDCHIANSLCLQQLHCGDATILISANQPQGYYAGKKKIKMDKCIE